MMKTDEITLPTESEFHNVLLKRYHLIEDACKNKRLRRLNKYIRKARINLENGIIPNPSFLEESYNQLQRDYKTIWLLSRTLGRQTESYETFYASIQDSVNILKTELLTKPYLKSTKAIKIPDFDKLLDKIGTYNTDYDQYLKGMNRSLLSKDAKLLITEQFLIKMFENNYEVSYEYVLFELSKYSSDKKTNCRTAYEILKYKTMCGDKSDVYELRNCIAHSNGMEYKNGKYEFRPFKQHEPLSFSRREFYSLPLFLIEKDFFILMIMWLIDLHKGNNYLKELPRMRKVIDKTK